MRSEEIEKLNAELRVAKENLRGATTQCKSKDMELERLQIKIRRLDKELEMNKTAQNFGVSPLPRQQSRGNSVRVAVVTGPLSNRNTTHSTMFPPILKQKDYISV